MSKAPSVAFASSAPAGREKEEAGDVPFSKSGDVVTLESVLGELVDPCGETAASGEVFCRVEGAICEGALDSGDEVEVAFWGDQVSSGLEPAPGPYR